MVLAFGGAIYSLQATTVANAVLLFSASPFFAAILGRLLLHEVVAPLTWLSMALAACGVLVMVDGSIGRGAVDGNLAALISAFGFGSFTVALRWGKVANMFPAVAMGALLSVATGAVVALALGQALLVPTHDIVVSIGMGVVTLAGGLLLYTAGARVCRSTGDAALDDRNPMARSGYGLPWAKPSRKPQQQAERSFWWRCS